MINNNVDEVVETPKEAPQAIQKPFTVARQDFIDGVVALINTSGLPAFVIVDIIKDVQAEMVRQANDQYQKDKEAYDAAVKQEG